MRDQLNATLLFVACGLTIIALCSVPLIIEAGGTSYRWGALAASVALGVVCWVGYARRPGKR